MAARIWTPCVDSLWERCTWELEFTVPSIMPNRTDLPPNVVVSSGELMEQVRPHQLLCL
jgi:transcription initiation factor TFIID subunit 2